jgi:hypothetical protein
MGGGISLKPLTGPSGYDSRALPTPVVVVVSTPT